MILILAMNEDPHADAVIWYLHKWGAKTARIDPEDFVNAKARVICRPDKDSASLYWKGKKLDGSDIGAVYCRNYNFFQCDENGSIADKLAANECESALGGFLRNLNAWWLNDPFREDFADNKLFQYHEAIKHGLQIPKTLVCNDPKTFMEFYQECGGHVIIKQLGEICLLEETPYVSPYGDHDLKAWGFYTRRVEEKDLEFANEVANAPCLLQEEIPKSAELRVNIVGRKFFAWRIFSQTNSESRVDFRRIMNLPSEKTELTATLKEKLLALVHGWGIDFAAIDLVETPDGKIIFLETNVCGNWLWLEPGEESEVAAAIARLLIENQKGILPPCKISNSI